MKPTKQLRIPIGHSSQLGLFILLVHTIPVIACWLFPVPLYFQLLCTLVAIVSGFHSWYQLITRAGGSTVDLLILDARGNWHLQQRDGELLRASLSGSSFVSGYLVIMMFSLDSGGRQKFMLLPDAVDPELLRQLRIRLRDYSATA